MTYTTQFVLELANFCSFCDKVWISNKFQVEFCKICLDINALMRLVVPIIDQHKIGVNFPSAVFADYNTNLITLASDMIYSSNWPILEERRGLELWLGHHNTELGKSESSIWLAFTIYVVNFDVSNKTGFDFFKHYANLCEFGVTTDVLQSYNLVLIA